MSSSIIKVENLGKRYFINSKKENQKFPTLRDALSSSIKSLSRIHHKSFETKEFWALENISFEIPQGARIGIIGRNGAGKSTLLKLLSRVVYPTKGIIELNGRIASLLEVGTGFHPELTGRENIYLNGAILGMTKKEIKKKFDEIVHFSGTELFLDTPVKRYSSGMYVRLAFSVAANLESDVLIVDEVLAVGDTEFQEKCLGKMNEVSTSGKTVIFVSHNLQTIKRLCTQSIVLQKGQITFNGSTEDAIKYYMNESKDSRIVKESQENFERIGNGKIRFTKVTTLNNQNIDCCKFSIGDDIYIKLLYTLKERVKNFYLSIELWTEDGIKLSNIVSFDSKYYPSSDKVDNQVLVKLNDFRFYPGKYYLTVWAGDSITHETYDHVFNVYSFSIIDGGKLVDRKLSKETGLLLITPEWNSVAD
jgi:lipopolysaccharide transport system ATP-binding protein